MMTEVVAFAALIGVAFYVHKRTAVVSAPPATRPDTVDVEDDNMKREAQSIPLPETKVQVVRVPRRRP
jgi:hypothetical protein